MTADWLPLMRVGLPAQIRGWDPRLLWVTLALVAVILVGAIVISLVDRWRKQAGQEASSSHDQLADFRKLYEAGELSQEEYDRIRGRLTQRLRRELDRPAAPSPPATSESDPRPPEAPVPDRPEA